MITIERNLDHTQMGEASSLLQEIDAFKTNEEWIQANTEGYQKNYFPFKNSDFIPKDLIDLLEKFDNCINPFMNRSVKLNDLKNIAISVNLKINPDRKMVVIDTDHLNMCFRRYHENKKYLMYFECIYIVDEKPFYIRHYISASETKIIAGDMLDEKSYFQFRSTQPDNTQDVLKLEECLQIAIELIQKEFLRLISISNHNDPQVCNQLFDDIKLYKKKK